jgi:murein DD-endopeptidase MepM/ murein hydrolase activator NlpD
VTSRPPTPWERFRRPLSIGSRVAAGVLFVLLMSNNRPVAHIPLPRPIAPQQLSESTDTYFDHTFRSGESLYRVAKYAICYFRALVPSAAQVSSYAQKMLDLHNRTRLPGEAGIKNVYDIPVGTQVRFYPPTDIVNPREDELLPAYRYFNSVVKDPFAYITGDWCERGTGGGNPHYGVDVAANYGAEIISPIDGTVIVRTSGAAGRMVGVVRDGMLLFFAHMDKRYVKTGQKVTKGDALGTIGMTGRTSGPHVHIGYGLRTPSGGINFGRHRYRLTDPKLFFYREEFLKKQG